MTFTQACLFILLSPMVYFQLQNINWKIKMFEKLFLLKHLNDCKQPFLILYTLTKKINLHKFTLPYNF